MPQRDRRIVITGLGTVAGLGEVEGGGAGGTAGTGGINALWADLVAGKTCLGPITRFDASGFPCRLGGEVKGFSAKDYVPKHYRKAVKVMARDVELAVGAARRAAEDAGIVTRGSLPEGSTEPTTYPADRMGCQVGAGIIAADPDELAAALYTAKAEGTVSGLSLAAWGSTGMENLTPLWLLKYLPNMLACHVTIIHGAEGPSNTITCAEASGLLSIGESLRVIARGSADLCFSGGAETKINLMGLLRQDLAGRLAHTGGLADGAAFVRPYDGGATGTIPGEGGGILILEEAGSAGRRGARVYAEVAGFGAGHSDVWGGGDGGGGDGAGADEGYLGAIEGALDDADISPGEVDAIAPLASGIPAMDRAELGALRAVFGDRLARVPLITLCGNLGNTVAGAGAIQAAVAAKAIFEGRLPARLHGGRPPAGVDAGPAISVPRDLRHVLVCSGANGGQNAAIVLRKSGHG